LWLSAKEAECASEWGELVATHETIIAAAQADTGLLTMDRRFAMTELQITLTTIFRRFEFELFETTREKEIDTARDCFLAETEPGSVGVRVKVTKVLEE
jgi:hypothetical protein